MFRKIILSAVSALALAGGAAHAAEGGGHVEDISFSFEGPFGTYDKMQLQRGLQVYTEVCAACHGLRYVPIRTLADPGGPELPADQVRAYAAAFPVLDEESNRAKLWDAEKGEMRPLKDTDNFPINFSAGAPDLSLMAKGRAAFHGPYGSGINQLFRGIGGPEYIHGILTAYTGESKDEAGSTFYENHIFSTGWIKMPAPLSDGQVTYADGSPNDVDHMAQDVSAFLMWAAEPKMMDRKQAGFLAVVFLTVLAALLYLTNKKIWAKVKGKEFTA